MNATRGLVPYLSEPVPCMEPLRSDQDGRGAGHSTTTAISIIADRAANILPTTNQNSRPVAAGLKAETAGMARRARAESFMVAIP